MREMRSRLQDFGGCFTKSTVEEYFTNMITEIWVTTQDASEVACMYDSGKDGCSIKRRKRQAMPAPADKQWSYACSIGLEYIGWCCRCRRLKY
jgi:hypothetical protein